MVSAVGVAPPPATGVVVVLVAAAAVVVVALLVVVTTAAVVLAVVVPAPAVPGMHWEYHSLAYVQVNPDTQVVEPVNAEPPPIFGNLR